MSSSSGIFSQTLREITTTKLQELSKKRAHFEKLKSTAIANSNEQVDPVDRLVALAEGTRACFGVRVSNGKVIRGSSDNSRLETDLRNLSRFIDQARFDPSISSKTVEQWRQTLLDHLEKQSLKYQYADLYGQLTVEWLTASTPKEKRPKQSASDVGEDDDIVDFEQVAVKAKLEAREEWERSVFEDVKINKSAIVQFLDQLFQGQDAQKALIKLREGITDIENDLGSGAHFNSFTLKWTIKGLLASDILTNEKRGILRDFLANETILNELADVLNMRMAALDSWSWGPEVIVEARRELNGKFNIYMHEDLLQAIFLQYIGVRWSHELKARLMDFVWNKDLWDTVQDRYSPVEKQRRAWFLPPERSTNNVEKVRGLHYRAGYFVSQLLDSAEQDLAIEEGDAEADFAEFARSSTKKVKRNVMEVSMGKPAAAMASAAAFQVQSKTSSESEEDMGFGGLFEDDAPNRSAGPPDLTPYRPANSMDAKQRLLHLLSTEILVKTRIDGEITAFRSQFKAWYPSLPHATINTVLSYLGISQKWLNFFKSFLQAPIKFSDEDTPPRLRKRGTPDAHVLSDVFGELVLFCLDFTISKQTGSDVLWRMKDDFWFWSSSHQTCVDVWKTIDRFNEIMGISLDDTKSAAVRLQRKQGKIVPAKLDRILPEGQIRWGMLYLDPQTGRFSVDPKMVDKHIEELRKQLKDKEKSIFAWIQAYSTYASVFFTTNFGKSANCFGREHLDIMLSMHERVQRTLFQATADGSITSVVDWLKAQIEQRFGVKDVPDGYLFFPTQFGGLEVKSPFIGLLQLRDSVTKDPNALLDDFEKEEREAYARCKKRYLDRKPWLYPANDNQHRPSDPEEFMSFEEYTQFREELNYGFVNELVEVYEKLLQRPREEPLENDDNPEIDEALSRCRHSGTESNFITYWYQMNPYWKWVTMLYGPEMIDRFGGLEIVDAGLLPMGMVSMFRSGKVSWRE